MQNSGGRGSTRTRRGRRSQAPGATGSVAAGTPDAALPAQVALLRERLSGFHHEHVAPLRITASEGRARAQVLAAPALGLADLVQAPGRLLAGEVVTVLVPLARAVDALHERGVVAGGIGPREVGVDATGTPLLLCRDPAPETVTARDADLRSLAELGWVLLTGRPSAAGGCLPELVPELPLRLAGLLTAVLDAPIGALPPAREFAAQVLAGCAPLPLRLPSPAEASVHVTGVVTGTDHELPTSATSATGDPPDVDALLRRVREAYEPQVASGAARGLRPSRAQVRGGRRRAAGAGRKRRALPASRRPLAVAAVVVGFTTLACIVVIGWLHPHASSASSSTSSPAAPATGEAGAVRAKSGSALPDWRAVLAGLDASRSRAYATGNPTLLRLSYAPGSPALARDLRTLASYRSAGVVVRGRQGTLLGVTERACPAGDRVELRVVDATSAYVLSARAGPSRTVPPRAARSWTVELHRVAERWLTWEVASV